MKPFLEIAKSGKSSRKRYVFGLISIILVWLVLATVIYLLQIAWAKNDNNYMTFYSNKFGIQGFSTFTNYMILNLTFWPLLFGVMLVMKRFHNRSIKTVFTAREKINFFRIFKAFLVFMLFLGLGQFIDYLIWPDNFRVTFNAKSFIPFLIVVPVMTTLQVLSEELLMRGYLLQATSRFWGNSIFIILINTLFFVLLHVSNPEVSINATGAILYYAIFGIATTYFALKDNSIELSLGMHAAVNIFLALIASSPYGVIQTRPIITIVGEYSVGGGLIGFIVFLLIFRMLFIKKENQD